MKNGDYVYPTKAGYIRKARRGEQPIGVKIPADGKIYSGFIMMMKTRDGAEHMIAVDTVPLLYSVNNETWTYTGKIKSPPYYDTATGNYYNSKGEQLTNL